MNKIKFLIIIGIILILYNLKAESWSTYYSPGIQFGYSPNSGFFVSTQLTVGSTKDNKVSLINDNHLLPGVTLGWRYYFSSKQKMCYIDAQASAIIAGFGAGYGVLFHNNEISHCTRAKLFTGFIGNLTTDFCIGKRVEQKVNYGVILVFPYSRFEM